MFLLNRTEFHMVCSKKLNFVPAVQKLPNKSGRKSNTSRSWVSRTGASTTWPRQYPCRESTPRERWWSRARRCRPRSSRVRTRGRLYHSGVRRRNCKKLLWINLSVANSPAVPHGRRPWRRAHKSILEIALGYVKTAWLYVPEYDGDA